MQWDVLEPPNIPPNSEAGSCRDCGSKGEFLKLPGLNSMNFKTKDFLVSSLRDGLCEPCTKKFDEKRERLKREALQMQQEKNRRRRYITLLGGMGPEEERIYDEFVWGKLDSKLNPRLYESMRKFDPAKENFFVYSRETGTGKTCCSTAVARAALDAGKKAMVIKPMRLKEMFLEAEGPLEEKELVRQLSSLDVLVIDDLGRGGTTSYRIDILCSILEVRANSHRSGLIVNSNFDLNELMELFGPHGQKVTSRIAGMCAPPYGRMLNVPFRDLRFRVNAG